MRAYMSTGGGRGLKATPLEMRGLNQSRLKEFLGPGLKDLWVLVRKFTQLFLIRDNKINYNVMKKNSC